MGQEATSVAFTSGHLVGRLLLSSFGDRDGEAVSGSIDLRADEGVVVELSRDSVLPPSPEPLSPTPAR